MEQTFFCVLGLFLLNSLHCAFAQEPTPHLRIKSNWPQIFWGERITLVCEIKGSGDDEWSYIWRIRGGEHRSTHNEYNITFATSDHNGRYECIGKRTPSTYTDWSNTLTLQIIYKPWAILGSDSTVIQSGDSVVLTCEVNPQSSGWRYVWSRGEKVSEIQIPEEDDPSNGRLRVENGGDYWCRGARGNPPYYTYYSDQVTITRMLLNEAVVTGQPEWKEVYSGERISLSCIIQKTEADTWEYEWETPSRDRSFTAQTSRDISIAVSARSDGEYKCRGKLRTDSYSTTEWSTPITIKVSERRPKAELSADNLGIPPGGNVTLTCSVRQSSGWKYHFYQQSSAYALKTQFSSLSRQMTFSEVGLYSCEGFRGDPAYSTGESQTITIHKNNENKAVVTLQPPWTEFYYGEKITVTCEIEGGEDSEWEFEWDITSQIRPYPFPKEKKFTIEQAYTSHSGDYRCKGTKTADRSSTNWSDSVTVTVVYNPLRPVLRASPSWPSPGDSVTLTCGVKHPSDGWRFFWYKAVPKPPGDSYNHELLSESSNGTEHRSYIVHGRTHTTAYACRAGRGNKLYTEFSHPQFVWSGDNHPSASLTVTPDRVQHLISDSVSLFCSGNSSQWRVRSFQKDGLSVCSEWKETTESTCTIGTRSERSGVYWCESGSGELSNAVNITKNNYDIILVSPVKPVTEKSSVILSCKLRKTDISSYVSFYHNDKLIQNDTRMELNISAVTKSNEGFYKCQTSGRESDQSWMSVKAVNKHGSSSFPEIPVIVVLICIIVLLILIVLLLYCHRRSKGTCFSRTTTSQNTNNAAGQKGLHGEDDVNHYDTIKAPEDNTNGRDTNQDVTYSLIEIKNMEKKRTQAEPNESMVYSAVKKKDAEEEVLVYAQVSHNNQRKDKKKAGRAKPASTEEPVYSEVKSNQK